MSRSLKPAWTSCLLLATITSRAAGSAEIVHQQRGGLRASAGASAFQKEISDAMGTAMGCGGRVGSDEIHKIEERLRPAWNALPKNSFGRIEKRMLRYVTYRYFMDESSMILRGFEASRPAQSSDWAWADSLSRTVPGFVESMLQSEHSDQQGFGLRDAAYVVMTLQQLVFDSETALLQKAYAHLHWSPEQRVGKQMLQKVLEEYLIYWLIGDNPDGLRMLESGRWMVTNAIPHWNELTTFVAGQIQSFRHFRQRAGKSFPSANDASHEFSFDDAHQIVAEITRTFDHYWLDECNVMEDALAAEDPHGTGRVPLSRFYSFNLDGEWRFGESEQYLRELGALDESASWRGKQVIIPNYIQAASNCVVTHSHYLVCCKNRCVGVLEQIEEVVGAPVADAQQIWDVVQNVSFLQGADDDRALRLPGSMRKQLDEIAGANSGQVPLHGRLFSQWLHYAFPRDCPFPSKAATSRMVTPSDFGTSYTASMDEMRTLAEAPNESVSVDVTKEDQQWMSQWSTEEELLADYANHRPFSWGRTAGGAVLLGVLAVAALAGISSVSSKASPSGPALPMSKKAHSI